MDKDYKVTFAEARNRYPTAYGDMQAYALKLEGVDGFVQLGQKPETRPPEVGDTLFGHTYEQNSSKGTFLKFKKVNPNYENNSGSTPQSSSSQVVDPYVVELLEAIAEKVGAGNAVKRKDTVLEDIDEGEEIDLSEIPF